MAVSSSYSNTYTRDIVTVNEIGARGALCSTSYGAEISVLWGANLPSPVPQVGERWYVQKIASSRWAFESKITGLSYSLVKYSMSLDMWSCIGRERSVVDDIAGSGVSEVYLTVADGGIVYWDSEVASKYGLKTCDVDGEPYDYVEQVVSRCREAGLAVTFVIDCNLWSDVNNKVHNHYQQVRYTADYVAAFGWLYTAQYTWGDVENWTWNRARNSNIQPAEGKGVEHVPTWSFITAMEPVGKLVSELYAKYSDAVRGVCFRNWHINGMTADASAYVSKAFSELRDASLGDMMCSAKYSDLWWIRRSELMDFFAQLQIDFLQEIRSRVGNWPISAIVPAKTLCMSSERMGRLDTWLDDDFSSYGWSKVGCPLEYSKSIDEAYELRSFEFLVASLRRFAEDASALYIVDVEQSVNYEALFNVLAKYNVTNVLLDDYDHWRYLSDQQAVDLANAMNTASVTPVTTLDEVGFYLSSNSREIAFHDDADVNKYQRSAQELCITLLDRLPHRIRIYYDSDMEYEENLDDMAAIVLFESLNMSYEAVDAVNSVIDDGGKNVVIVGRCGLYSENSLIRRFDVPFLDRFGEVDFGMDAYETQVSVKAGRLGAFDVSYAMDGECVGILPTRHTDPDAGDCDAVGYLSDGSRVAAPVYFKGRTSAISIDILDEPALTQMVSEMVLLAIGREK